MKVSSINLMDDTFIFLKIKHISCIIFKVMYKYSIVLISFLVSVFCQGQINYFPQTDQVGIMLNPAVSGLNNRPEVGVASGFHEEKYDQAFSTLGRNNYRFQINQLTFSAPLPLKFAIGGYLLNRNFVSDVYLDGYDPSYTTFTYNSTYKKYNTADFGMALSRPFYLDKKSQEESNHILIPAVSAGVNYQQYLLEKYSSSSPTLFSTTEKTFHFNQATIGLLYQYRQKLMVGSKVVSYSNLYDGISSKVYLHASYMITSKNGKGKFMFKPSLYTSIYGFRLTNSPGERLINTNGAMHYYNRGVDAILQFDFRCYGILWGLGFQSYANHSKIYVLMIGYEAKSFRTTLNISTIGKYYNSGSFTFVKYFGKKNNVIRCLDC